MANIKEEESFFEEPPKETLVPDVIPFLLELFCMMSKPEYFSAYVYWSVSSESKYVS